MGAIGLVAVAVIGAADVFVAPTWAQIDPSAAEPVSRTQEGDAFGLAVPPVNTAPAASDDAHVVAFVSATPDGTKVAVRDRTTNVTEPLVEAMSSHPGVSGDGCVVAYLVEVPADPGDPASTPTVELRAVDRCKAPGLPGALVDTYDVADATGAPVISRDGGVIVRSTGTAVVRYIRLDSDDVPVLYTRDETFDPVADAAGLLPAGVVTGPVVDVSGDAGVVAFVAGPGSAPYAPEPPDVYVWTNGAPPVVELASMPGGGSLSPPEAGSSDPALSGDGSIVLFESNDLDLAANAGNAGTVTPFVVAYHRGFGSVVLDGQARRPAISTDGHHAVYDHAGVVRAVRWGEGSPFGGVTSDAVFTSDSPAGGESVSGPLVSRHGHDVIIDTTDGAALTGDSSFHTGTHVWAIPRPQQVEGTPVDLGTVEVPGTLYGPVTLVNTGAAGVPIDAVTVDAPFTIVATTCVGVLHPGVSCTVDVAADLASSGSVVAVVRLTGGIPTTEFGVEVSGAGTDPTTTTTTAPGDTTTTEPGATTTTTDPGATTTTTRAAPTTNRPRSTTPRATTPRATTPRATTPRSTTPPSTSPPRQTTTTLPAPVVFNPPAFDFPPTIVDAGRRTASIDLFNPAVQSVAVVAVGIEGGADSGFSADGAACVGQPLASGVPCPVAIEFAPTVEGARSATLVADLSDGTRATAALTGFGAPPPTLTVTPGVAANNQVVTVVGAGFPAGITVELSWNDGRVTRTPLTDGAGGFVETFVVLPNTIGGPTEVRVAGQIDLFGDVAAPLLVSSTGSRSDVAVYHGLGPSVVR